jgi:hypothetical protein
MKSMEPASTITFDDSLWPLLVVRFSGTPTQQQFEEYLATRQKYLDRREKHVLIYDTVRFQVLTPEQRQRQINWLRERARLMQETSLGSALIIISPVARMLLSMVLQFSQAKTPYHAARSMPEAARWAAERLDGAGLVQDARRVRVHFGLTPQQQQLRAG